jgi:hypothetical protein
MVIPLYVLGIVIKNNGRALFILVIIAFICHIILVYKGRTEILGQKKPQI